MKRNSPARGNTVNTFDSIIHAKTHLLYEIVDDLSKAEEKSDDESESKKDNDINEIIS